MISSLISHRKKQISALPVLNVRKFTFDSFMDKTVPDLKFSLTEDSSQTGIFYVFKEFHLGKFLKIVWMAQACSKQMSFKKDEKMNKDDLMHFPRIWLRNFPENRMNRSRIVRRHRSKCHSKGMNNDDCTILKNYCILPTI